MLTAIVYVLTGGCSWSDLPFVPIAHRWFADWTKAEVWRRLWHSLVSLTLFVGGVGLVQALIETLAIAN